MKINKFNGLNKLNKHASRSIEDLKQEAAQFQENLKESIENDGGSISDYRLNEMGKQELMSKVLFEINNHLYFLPIQSLSKSLEELKQKIDSMELDINQSSELAGIMSGLFRAERDIEATITEIKNLIKGAE